MKLYLIRHAESLNNARPVYERISDPPLTARGRLQAQGLADWLTKLQHDVLITSPFRRTLETTRAFLDQSPRRVHVWHQVFENGGCFEGHEPANHSGAPGLGRTDIRRLAHADEELCIVDDTITEDGWWNQPHRETPQESEQRTKSVVARFVDEFGATRQSVVAILHADFIRGLVAEMLGPSVSIGRLGPFVNVGVTLLRYQDGQWHLDWLNSISHVPPRLVTGKE